uniref:Uncharacterized protein n=1 Tax=Mastacembelus armatus TaxID=205130 RepID=A0A3Q3SRK9_9TELE
LRKGENETFTREPKGEQEDYHGSWEQMIAALMLAKHQEEQVRRKLSQQEEQERQEARRQEEAQRAEAEKKRRKRLKQSMQRWHEELEARRMLKEQQEKEKAKELEQEVLLQGERWRRLMEEVEAQRREKIEAAQKDAEGRKCYQEKLLRKKEEKEKREQERERQVAVEREQNASKWRTLKQKKEKKRLQEENQRELIRHKLLKQQVEQQAEEAEAEMRSTFEMKRQHFCEKHAQVIEARQRELQEQAARIEEQIQRAQLRAKMQSVQQLRHKQVLVHLSQRRMERATLHATAQYRNRVQQVQQLNKHRQICHQRCREKMQREEEAMRKVRECDISMKEWRRERLWRQRDPPVFGLSILGYCRNMVAQHGCVCERRPAPYVDLKGSF